MSNKKVDIKLPDSLTSKHQLKSVQKEIDTILDQAIQGSIRKEQTGASFAVNKPSQTLSELMVIYESQLTIKSLKELKVKIEDLERRAIVLRIVLSNEPSHEIQARIVRWFRSNFDKPILMRFGIQPAIAGGLIVYTPNHRHDFSLRTKILESDTSIRSIMDGLK